MKSCSEKKMIGNMVSPIRVSRTKIFAMALNEKQGVIKGEYLEKRPPVLVLV